MRTQLAYVDLRPVLLSEPRRLYDPVDPAAARLLPETDARRYGMLPFAVTPRSIHVAACENLSEDGLQLLAGGERSVRLWRAHPAQLRVAQDRVWTPSVEGATPVELLRPRRPTIRRLGEILVETGLVSQGDVTGALQEQQAAGGRLGAILVSANRASWLTIANGVARQHELPLVDLLTSEDGRQGLQMLDPALFRVMPAGFWRDHLLVPLGIRGNRLTVAMADPDDALAVQQLGSTTGREIRHVVTGYQDVLAVLQQIYAEDFSEESRQGLLRDRPEDSASYTLTTGQRAALVVLGLLALLGLLVAPLFTLVTLNAMGQAYYLGSALLKLWLIVRLGSLGHGVEIPLDELSQIDRADLPMYTVLVPIYREARVLPVLARALSELDYPHDRLDVKLLMEADDAETIAAAQSLRLPGFIDSIIVPPSEPRTKPKACNYGLRLARGQYTVIFDAEDIPEPDQLLKAVAAFRKADHGVACVQAKLAYFNPRQNLLTRWFTAEYLMWFDLLLPALHALRLPIPLGGTSNHFRTDVLRKVGAWDPHNVAEDADLGIRLYKAGYKTAVIDATTYEEANSRTGNWIRQRSRWVKGYLQTWLVHMRHPVALWRALGPRGFVGFQLIVGGTPLTLLLNPLYALLTTLWYLTHTGVLHSLLPPWLYYVAAVNLLLGNLAFTYTNMVAVARRNLWDMVAWTAFSPCYWTLMSVAAWKALVQLITRPSYWEKTDHGLTSAPATPGVAERGTAS